MRQLDLPLNLKSKLSIFDMDIHLGFNTNSVHSDYVWKTLTSTFRSLNHMPQFNPVLNRG